MPGIQTFLPPPPGVQMITAWDDCNGEWYAERMPLVCIKASNEGGYLFDAMGVDGDCLHDKTLDSIPVRALLLADGRVVVPQIATYENVDDWLANIKKEADRRKALRPGLNNG